MTFLDEVVQEKKEEIKGKKRSLVEALDKPGISVIAEVKRKSPSEGEINELDAIGTATAYEAGGASAISVLTDSKHFGGSLKDLTAVKEAVDIPVLRKDFIVDEFQLYEALVYGADAVLLIATVLEDDTSKFVSKARELSLESVVEIHGENEVEYAIKSGAKLIGINNRDLKGLNVDLSTFEMIAPMMPKDRILIAESGINSREDVNRMINAGADAILVGTALMKSGDIENKLREFKG